MTAELVNLRRARKVRARDAALTQAAANRAAHGRTRAEKQATTTQAELQRRTLDGAQRER